METERSGGAHILLVDDEPSLLKMMSVYLARLGYFVTTAQTTEQAAALARDDPNAFSLAVVDATMSGLSMMALGLEMLQANDSLRFLAASGYPVDMQPLEAVAPGRVGFLHKPFTPEMLATAIRRIFGTQEEDV